MRWIVERRKVQTQTALLGAALVMSVLAQGCVFLGEDLDRFYKSCNFDLVDARICPSKNAYRVEGFCLSDSTSGMAGVYLFEGKLTYNRETQKAAESYEIEPSPIIKSTLPAGEILISVSCNRDPFLEGNATCWDKKLVSSYKSIPGPLFKALSDANPVADSQFSSSDIQPYIPADNCEAPPEPPPPEPPPEPGCKRERRPALFITAPLQGQSFQLPRHTSISLEVGSAIRRTPRSIEIEWQKFVGRGFIAQGGLPTSAAWTGLPLEIGMTDDDKGAGEGLYRVRVRPFDPKCERRWSFWQEFETLVGGPEVQSMRRGPDRGDRGRGL